jgi:hypothetical protein
MGLPQFQPPGNHSSREFRYSHLLGNEVLGEVTFILYLCISLLEMPQQSITDQGA